MKMIHLLLLLLLVFLAIILTSGCASYVQPMRSSNARLGAPTAANKLLNTLPKPKEPIVAAVYKFRDQTGQYKQIENGSSFSTAVTQGATSILLRALEDSKWFIAIEREGLSNLLNERKIIRSSRIEYETPNQNSNQPVIPPLLFGGVILEGGIISYDTNVLTGGAGLQYFGLGASGEYREDRVSVYLRAISTQNGRILKTVYTTKTILSQKVDVNLYRFVKVQRLLEAETGYSYNEPTEMAVTEAIEKSVQSLVIEGILNGLWATADSAGINSKAVQDYLREKAENETRDQFMRPYITQKTFGISAGMGSQIIASDYSSPSYMGNWGLDFKYTVTPDISLNLGFNRGQLKIKNLFQRTYNTFNLEFQYGVNPGSQLRP
ncbi:MAG: CsgG/HfaB family protein, partial [Syntrophothermus sp.]